MGECLIIRSGGGTDTSDATATSGVVLSGYTCYVNDELVTGSMIAQNPGNQSLTPGGEYTIEEGYYDGTDEISVTSLSENTSADAIAGYILTGYNAWVNGSNVSGSMANQGNVSQSLAANGSYTIPAGWHAGAGVVNQSLATQGAVNVTPGTANKTACAANRWTTGNIIVAGASTLTAGNIRNGITIFGIRGTFTGWVDNPSAEHQATNLTIRQSSAGSDGGWRYYWVRSVSSINMTGWNTLWVRGEAWDYWDSIGLYESFATNDGIASGCPWEYHAYWDESFAYFGIRNINYTRNGDWWIATKSELKQNDTMSGEYVLCVSCYGRSVSNSYPPLQPTLYWRLGL